MSFIAYKIISLLLMPFTACLIILMLGLLALFCRWLKSAKALISLSTIALLVFSFPGLSNHMTESLENSFKSPQSIDDSKLAGIVVLYGGASEPDQKQPEDQLNSITLQRALKGIMVWQQHPSLPLILSGGNFKQNNDNAYIMKNLALKLGVPNNKIAVETESLNTHDEAVVIRKMLGPKPIILVTSAIHMPRSLALFKKVGMLPIPIATNFTVNKDPEPYQQFIPSAGSLTRLDSAWHEYLGMVWTKIRGWS